MFISKRLMAGVTALSLLAFSVPSNAKDAPGSFADMAEKLLPSVVNISTTQTIKNSEHMPEMPQFPPGSPFEEFFKNFMEKQKGQDDRPHKATSLGSGFIIDSAGYVVTNNHVIQDADEITVMLHDNSILKATVVGTRSQSRSGAFEDRSRQASIDRGAVWQQRRLQGRRLGIGHRQSLRSGRHRHRRHHFRAGPRHQAGPYDDFLQTDASINKGNSGGPMFNMARTKSSALTPPSSRPPAGPSASASPFRRRWPSRCIDDLKKYGKIRRGWLGVRIQSLDQDLADSMSLSTDKGALVAQVTEGGPAAKSDIKPGDVILTFDGKEIGEMRRLPRIVAETPIGKKVDVEIWRNGQRMTVPITVGELKDEPVQEAKADGKAPKDTASGSTSFGGLGLSVAAVTPQLRDKFGLDDQTKGLVVTDVNASGPAAEKGMRPGDIIIDAAQTSVQTPADFTKVLDKARSAGNRTILLRVENPQVIRYVVLPLDPKAKK